MSDSDKCQNVRQLKKNRNQSTAKGKAQLLAGNWYGTCEERGQRLSHEISHILLLAVFGTSTSKFQPHSEGCHTPRKICYSNHFVHGLKKERIVRVCERNGGIVYV